MGLQKKIWIVTIFAVAMAFLETAVVIYLRELLYPGGFDFPLVPIPESIALTEILREAATLIMPVSIGMMAGKNFSQGFAWFIYSFAIWDIFYYIFLNFMIGWPESLFTWDILFLIPTTWTGPVLSPVIVSFTMIFFALIILVYADKGKNTRISRVEWTLLITGSLVLIFGFVLDYSKYMLKEFKLGQILSMNNKAAMEHAFHYIPNQFPWWIFILGELIILAGILIFWKRVKSDPSA